MRRFAAILALLAALSCGYAFASDPLNAPRSQELPQGSIIPGSDARVVQRFMERRRNELPLIQNIAAEAGRGRGEDLGALATRLAAEYDAYSRSDGGDSSSTFRDFAHSHYAAARFLTELDSYRLMVRSNVMRGCAVTGTEFEGWEIGPPYENNWKVRFTARQLAGEVFAGLEMVDTEGLRRFDGSGVARPTRQLVVVIDPAVDEETQTVLDASAGRRIVNRTVFRASTGECLLREDF